MKSTIKLAFVALVIALASCTSKPAESTATEAQDSVATETPAAEPAVDSAAVAAPAAADSAVAK